METEDIVPQTLHTRITSCKCRLVIVKVGVFMVTSILIPILRKCFGKQQSSGTYIPNQHLSIYLCLLLYMDDIPGSIVMTIDSFSLINGLNQALDLLK